LPLQQNNAYVHRTGTEESIRRFLSRGQIPLVFGEYGVGKTTVVRKVLRELGLEPNLTYIATTAQRTLSDIFSMALEKLSVTITTSETTTGQTQADIGATFIVNASGSATHGVQTVRESVVKAPTSKAVIDILAHNHVVLVI